jgi:hypothetical protein
MRTLAEQTGGRGRGFAIVSESTKEASVVATRNAVLSWARLFTVAAEAVLLVTQVPIVPAYLGLAGLVLFGSLRSLVTRELSERHGAIIYALWVSGAQTNPRRLEQLRPIVNHQLRELGKPPMSERELRNSLVWLSDFGCVVPTLSGWRLKDRVRVTV